MERDSDFGSNSVRVALVGESGSDLKIMAMVRGGDASAFDVLYRRHGAAAQYVARAQTDNVSDADDVVSEAFASIFQALTEGKGPAQFFRSYLLTAVRRIAHDRNRKAKRTLAVGDESSLDTVAVDADRVLEAFESSTMVKAFTSLPERWQAVLWHVDIEGLKPAAAALFIGLSPNGVSSLAIRAREGLRQAYLQNHISMANDDSCFEYSSQLGKYARDGLKRTSREKVEAHLETCSKCTAVLVELNDVQAGMRAVVFPLVAGVAFTPAAAAGYLPPEALAPGVGGPTAAGQRSGNVIWKMAIAALVLSGLATGGVLIRLGQAAPIVTADATSSATAAPRTVPEAAPIRSVPSPSPVPTSDPPAIAAPEPPAAEPPAPVAAPIAYRTAPAAVPVPQKTAKAINSAAVVTPPVLRPSATVATTPVPQPSPTTAPPPQTVSASFGSQPGTGQPERQIDVAFSLHGDGTPTTGETLFSLSPEAAFVPGKLLAPAGWTCPDQSSGYIRCTTSSIDPHSLDFRLDAMISSGADHATLSYQFSGQRIAPTTFTNTFH
ncbi:sigma-70 family RNA polymerase sigma factor [Arthrobacter sp. MMS18-M83]|uniref:sigma-70 family RNA polymerase sigma factor n=1 Tax=Arthrobacter sp. MMS18-M83 TaxID=2996261 RepID=UPI00227A3FEA|nr:sigma-70 family RNA polymerase sigma factor [Arthrobacter sp. MMS18-M83]WAH98586.1 sigma-70 family RNA polymerase sigma factor [Arthrobacter sp. MMS18-M83]